MVKVWMGADDQNGWKVEAGPTQLTSLACSSSFPGLLLVTILVLLNHLDHLSLARSLPTAPPSPGMFQCLNHSQNLLRAVSKTLQKVSFSIFLFPLCSLSREGASLNPWSPEKNCREIGDVNQKLSRRGEGTLQRAQLLAKESQ